jgi:hypothetical protein
MRVYCVKIHQEYKGNIVTMEDHSRRPHTYDRFPFDRCYLWPVNHEDQIPVHWRYAFVYKLTIELALALYHMVGTKTVEVVNHQRQHRESSYSTTRLMEDRIIPFYEDWLLVVPTFASKISSKDSVPRQVSYSFSQAYKHHIAQKVPALESYFLTPGKRIPCVCAVCDSIHLYYENACTPGHSSCAKNMQVAVPRITKGDTDDAARVPGNDDNGL